MRMAGYIRSSSFNRLFSFRRHSFDDELSSEKLVPRPTHLEMLFLQRNSHGYSRLFSRKFGWERGCAEVYRGVLGDGQTIAVKRMTEAANEKDFLTEIGFWGMFLTQMSLLYLVAVLIMAFTSFSTSLQWALLLHFSIINGKLAPIDWNTRYKIAVGTARGLHYLHNTCPRRIIHRDVKSSNILLSEDFEPLISNFGLAKWLPSQWTHHFIAPIERTLGHIAPEYLRQGFVDEKTDVFAFGVFLLELLSGKEPVDSCHQSLRSWARPILKRGDVKQVVDPRLGPHYDADQLTKLAFAASLCIRTSPVCRPAISEVLEVIEMEEEIVMDEERWKDQEEEDGDDEDQWVWRLELDDVDYDTCSTISNGSN